VRVDSAAGFASHWNQIASSWLELPEGFPSFHVKYEDLIGGNFDFRKVESWLGIEITEKVAMSVIVDIARYAPVLVGMSGGSLRTKRLPECKPLVIPR
jgi:hypothetical protein